MLSSKLEKLRELLASFDSCMVAYSGGVDSALLAYLAHKTLGDRAIAAIADSPSLPRREFTEAVALANQFEFPLEIVRTREFENEEYLSNPINRCFFCKHELFTELEPLARERGCKVIAYGENASDIGDHRPGAKAAAEFEVRAPLKEVGLSKDEIRELSAQFGLPTASKPQLACLSSRIPYGERVTPEKLRMIEEAEDFLRDAEFRDVRVRHHEVKGAEGEVRGARGSMARIEVAPEDVARISSAERRSEIEAALSGIGYASIEIDPQGYRRGSMNVGKVDALAPAG
ncbi:MAG: ATP-dependent sacrificial sulfur transferase LarE [Verrucomicrobiia bacterium]